MCWFLWYDWGGGFLDKNLFTIFDGFKITIGFLLIFFAISFFFCSLPHFSSALSNLANQFDFRHHSDTLAHKAEVLKIDTISF